MSKVEYVPIDDRCIEMLQEIVKQNTKIVEALAMKPILIMEAESK